MMEFIYIYLILLTYFSGWFIISQVKKNNGLIDIAWGLSFVITALSSLSISGVFNLTKIILLTLIALWGFRLSFYLFKRNWNKPEDFRYQAMRNKWKTNLKLKAFIKVFVGQSILSYIIALPIILTNLYSNEANAPIQLVLLAIGVIIFLIGFIFEVIADKNLRDFKKDPDNKGKILTSGVWSLSRHPNYFGEATLWWGIGIISISSLMPTALIGLISPIVITVLLRFVSGVPLLEKKYLGNPLYESYKEKTPIFFPFLKKKKPKRVS